MEQITIVKKYLPIICIALIVLIGLSVLIRMFIGKSMDDNRGLSKKTPWVYGDIVRMEYTCYLLISMGLCGMIFHGLLFTIRSECIHEDMD